MNRYLLATVSTVVALCGGRVLAGAGGVAPGGISHWSAQWCFVDAFKHSLPWRSSDKDVPLKLDEYGWVKELAQGQHAWSLIYTKAGPHYPDQRYVARHAGTGTLEFSGAAAAIETGPGRVLLNVDPAKGGIRVELTATDPDDPLRNLELIPIAFEKTAADEPFHPRFLTLLDGFQVIRFTHLMHAGGAKGRAWEGRITPAHQTQAGPRGIALEYALALCNKLDVDAWFTMPVNSDAAYFRAFAKTVKKQLEPGRKIYVEYGDDVGVWPTASSQFCIKKGRELKLSKDWHQARSFYYAMRSAELFAIWNEVFADAPRLITVLNPIDDDACTHAGAAKGADAAGIVTLFGSKFGKIANIDHLLETGMEQLMDELAQEAVINEGVRAAIARSRRFDLEPVSFYMTPIICPLGSIEQKRGQDVLRKVMARTVAMQDHPRMEPIFRKYIRSWHEAGGGLWIHNGLVDAPSKWGWFGLLKHMNQDPAESPKFRAVRAELRAADEDM